MFISARRPRHKRLVAALAATYHPRKHFRLGQDIGWHWQFDDPNTLYRRRNLLTYSNQLTNAAWIKFAGAVSGSRFTATAGSAFHYTRQQVTTSAGKPAVFSVEVKYVNWSWLFLAGPNDSYLTYFNVQTGALGTLSSLLTSAPVVELLPDGYYRVTLKFVSLAAADCSIGLAANSSTGSFTAAGTEAVDIRNAQVEYGTERSEYQDVPTTWAQAYLDAVGAQNIYAWTDTAGTTPVTAIGEGIGLLLGREYGGARGVERWSDGAVALSGESSRVSPGVYRVYTSAGVYSAAAINGSLTIGKTYEATFTVDSVAAAGAGITFEGATTGSWTTTGAKRVIFTATGTAFGVKRSGAVLTDIQVSGISLREVPGTHLTQSTGTAKPTLSARVNLLLDTELLTAASWTKSNVSVAASPAADPNGGSKAFRITSTAANGFAFQSKSLLVSGATYKNRMFVRRVSGTGVVKFFGPDGSSFTDITAALSTSWAEFTYSGTQPGTAYGPIVQLVTSGDVVDVAFPDLRTADDAAKNIPAYQRVGATATDHDTDGFPHFMEGDGTDNCMASVATVDGSGSTKINLVAAVTKNSDAALGLIVENTVNSASQSGSFGLTASATPGTGDDYWSTAGSTRVPITSVAAAPLTTVYGGQGEIDVPLSVFRRAGVQVATSSSSQGTGNYANATLYVLSRAGTSFRFNGRFYGSTGRFGPMGDSERNNLTRWWMKRIGTA